MSPETGATSSTEPERTPAKGERRREVSAARAAGAVRRGVASREGGALAFLESWRPILVRLAAIVLLAAVAAVHSASGAPDFLSVLYVLPVALVAWRLGTRSGIVWSVSAALVFLAVRVGWIGPAATAGGPSAGSYLEAGAVLAFLAIIAAAIGRLRQLREEEWRLAGTDHLTGVLNGRAFHDLVELERSRTLRYNRPFTLAYMDVDGFKAVNDRLGHSAGDEALRVIADTIRDNIRSMDTVARLGGDEFGLLLPETGPGAAEVALRKIQLRLAEVTLQYGSGLSFSIGAIVCVGAPESVDALIQRADALMYDVKQAGRNGLRTVVLDESFGIEAILQRS